MISHVDHLAQHVAHIENAAPTTTTTPIPAPTINGDFIPLENPSFVLFFYGLTFKHRVVSNHGLSV